MVRDTFRTSRARVALLAACACACALLAALAMASSASAEGGTPQWALTVVPTPTNLVPESPRTEVDQLAVDAAGGSYRIDVAFKDEPHYTSRLPYDATAEQVQEALSSLLEETGHGSVVVTETPGGATMHVYRVEWAGSAADSSLKGDNDIESVGGEDRLLTGGGRSASFTTLTKGVSEAQLVVTATNVGSAATSGRVTLSDVVPSGLTVTSVRGEYPYGGFASMECEAPPAASCSYENPVLPGGGLIVTLSVRVAGGLPESLPDTATVSGGGVDQIERSVSLPVGEQTVPFGVAPGSLVAALSSSQAGSHPSITTAFTMATDEPSVIAGSPKDVHFDLPVGFVGNTVGMPRCSMQGVLEQLIRANPCPSDSMVGVATVGISFGHGVFNFPTAVFNIAPAPGEPAAFGFNAFVVPVRLDTSVLSNGNYGVRVTVPDINEGASLVVNSITIWGVPADMNGPGEGKTLYDEFYGGSFGGPNSTQRVPLLTNPQQCSEGLTAAMSIDAWMNPGTFVPSETVSLGPLSGCDQLRFSSSFSMVPDTLEAGAPAGYHFDLRVPQNTAPDGIATPNVKNVSLTLPEGTVVNPSAAWGLKACTNSEFYGPGHPSQEPASPADCPREAHVGIVQIKTPALEEALEGQVFLGTPECDPCTPRDAEDGRMVRLFVQAVSEGEGGIVVKLEGRGHINQQTGQITTTFENNPQLPFSEFKLKLAGGPRAVLANPRSCGLVNSNIGLTPWSAPATLDSLSSYSFEINQDCFGSQFKPSFVAGTPNIQAGAYTPFTLAFGRSDHDEFLGRIDQSLPPGLLGNIASVPLCREPQAARGTCPEGSVIGHVQALTGPGADPFLVSGGRVFLTEGYEGAPYGLSIVVPAVAGPYTLSGTTGRGTVVVRARIVVDPIDAHLTVISDPLPGMLDGIPLQLKAVNVTIDRPGFVFNPTDCSRMAIGGRLSSLEGMSANVASSFQVTNCATLAFKPQFKVFTNGKTSRKSGASLTVDLSYPKASWGSQANIRSVKVDLPKQLPSFLNTLQNACPGETFQADPAACPSGSIVGSATATTPILPVPLAGPAYFVSHGGAKWPELVIVLSGYGVSVQLHGETFINDKTKVTSSTFRTIPDVPIGTFQLNLPQGPNHALAANGDLCAPTRVVTRRKRVRVKQHGQTRTITRKIHKRTAASLVMATAFTAQNGLEIHQNTPITVTGCTRTKPHHNKHKHHKRKKK